ncbi:phage holin family protein [Neobacillus mesonae]|nr:phage holin family protein [Neobacillus mesonae]
MEWNAIFELIDPTLIGVLAACWVIGFAIRKIPKIPDWTIIFFVTVAAILFTVGMHGWSVQSLIQGILVAAFAVYGNQIVQQTARGVDQK